MTKRIILTDSARETEQPTAESMQSVDELTLIDIAQGVTKRARLLGVVLGSIALLTALVLFLIPNKYQSSATILPSSSPDQLSELKSLAGFGSLDISQENPSELFPSILRSRTISDSVLHRRYSFNNDGEQTAITLQEYFGQDDPDKLVVALNSIVGIATDKKTGVISFSVETEYPELSKSIAQTYLTQLETFNLRSRRSQARENATYLSRQVVQTKADLVIAEQALQDFQNVNRNWAESSDPEVLRIVTQLQREVEIQNRKFLYLTQEHEMAKLTAQKDVPIVSVMDPPSLPTEKSGPKRLTLLLFITVLSGIMLVVTITALEAGKRRLGKREQLLLEGLEYRFNQRMPFLQRQASATKESVSVEEMPASIDK